MEMGWLVSAARLELESDVSGDIVMAGDRAQRGRRHVRHGLLAVLLSSTWLVAPERAFSQTAVAQQSFNIPSGPLSTGLVRYGRQAGVQVSYSPTVATNVRTAGVAGAMTSEIALERLLNGTGLVFRFASPRTVVVERRSAPAGGATPAGAITLDTIDVRGAGDGTVGFVATRSLAGTKIDTPLIEVPQSISVVTREQMNARNVQTVAEAVRYVPGVSTEPGGADGRYDQIFIRGFNEYITGDYRDGLRQPGRSYSYFRTEPYGLQRIDVVRGPTSVLYGLNAPGGIVDRVSKLPTVEPVREIVLQGGTQDRLQGAFDLGGPVMGDDRYLYRVVGLARSSDNVQSSPLPDDRLYIAPSFTWKPTDATTLTLQAEALRDVNGYNFYYTAPGTRPTRITTGDPSFDRFQQEQYSAGSRFEHKFSDDLIVRQNLRFGQLSLDYHSVYGLGAVTRGTTLLPRTAGLVKEDLNALTVDNQVQTNLVFGPIKHQVLFGLDYQRWESTNSNQLGVAPPLNIAVPVYNQFIPTPFTFASRQRQVQEQLGFYVQDQMKIWDKLVLTFGARHDWAESKTHNRLNNAITRQDDSASTGRVGVAYLFENGFAPYASYSTSFQPVAGATSPARGSAPFKPTTGEQFEVGLKYQPTGWNSFFTVSLFELTQQNVTTTDPFNIVYRVQTGEVRSRGVELEAVASLSDGLSLIGSVTYQDVEVTKSNAADLGKRPTQVPERMASLWVDYTARDGALKGIGVAAGIRYVGSTFGDPANTIRNPSYALIDAALRYDLAELRPELKGWKASVNASNLLDKQYYVCSTGYCSWGSGRTVTGALRYTW